jgi:hypothetical protein
MTPSGFLSHSLQNGVKVELFRMLKESEEKRV